MRQRRKETAEYPFIIVGGGLSGICAAIAAARHGVRTALVQARPVLGGNASSEVRMHICGAGCHIGKKNLHEGGILHEILLENKARNPEYSFPIWDSVLWEKVRYQENLTLYLNTTMDAVTVEENRIRSILCHQETTEKEIELTGMLFADATGNGTLGYFAGAEYRMGSEASSEFGEPDAPSEPNNHAMGNTILFMASDRGKPVPFTKPFWAYSFTEEDLKFRGHGKVTHDHGENGVREEYMPSSGYWWVEVGGDSGDIIGNAEAINEELKKVVFGVWDHLKNGGDHGAENYELDWVGSVPGVRESRRLVGDYLLNENDVLANRIFPDAVAYGGWPMDEHTPAGVFDFDKEPTRYINFNGAYTIPYRCYYSKNIENLFMAGRDISTTKMALGTTRVMGTCAIGGQAVGTAAAIAIKENCSPREVGRKHITKLQQMLLKDDCYIPGIRNEDPADLARGCRVEERTAECRSLRNAAPFGHATRDLSERENLPEPEDFKQQRIVKQQESACHPENVLSGVSRTVEATDHAWESASLPTALTLTLSEPKEIREVRLTFDSNFSEEIMISMTRAVQERQVEHLPHELVRSYDLALYRDGNLVYQETVEENIYRLRVHPIPSGIIANRVVLTVRSTYGYPHARVYEVRIY